MIGAMVSQGYSKGYSGALIAAGSTIGPVIPPSIPMIMYGVTIGVSVSYMFIAGIIPGILMGVALMIYNYFTSKKRGYKGRETQAKTAASIRQRRFALDLKKRITNASTAPITPPVSRERPISRSGSSTIA